MSEYKHNDSPEYIEMSPTRRYYNDVGVVRENLTSAILAIDNFAQKFPTDDMRLFTKMMASEMRPMEWEMENDIVIAKEKLSLLPLCVIAQDLESSDCNLDDLKDWYREALGGVRMITGDVHTNECLEYRQMTHDMCDYSTICPRRFSQRFLLFPAMVPDFTMDIYKTAPKRQFTIVKHKLELAMRQELVASNDCEDIKEVYCKQYDAYMSSRSLSAPDKII